MTTVKDIVKEYLTTNGYDGLCNGDCGCGLDDLMPCDYAICDSTQPCVIAKKVIATEEHCQPQFNNIQVGDEIFVPVEIATAVCVVQEAGFEG